MKTRREIEAVYQDRIELIEKMAARAKSAEDRLRTLHLKNQWEQKIQQLQAD